MTSNDELLNAEKSPSGKNGIKNVNKWPLYIAGGVLGVFLLVVMLVAMDRSQQQHDQSENSTKPDEQKVVLKNDQLVDEVIRGYDTGIVPAHDQGLATNTELTKKDDQKKDKPPVTEVVPFDINNPSHGTLPTQQNQQLDYYTERQKGLKIKAYDTRIRKLESAVYGSSSIAFNVDKQSSGASGFGSPAFSNASSSSKIAMIDQEIAKASALLNSGPEAILKNKLQGLQTGGLNGLRGLAGLTGANTSSGNSSNPYQQLGQNDWSSHSKTELPKPYELKTGFVISGVMITGINSDLPSQIIGQVSENVYDTATGRHLLIPQGTKLIGAYSSGVKYGQERVLIAWNRLVFPDGRSKDIGSMAGVDSAGYAGFEDKVNHHFFRVFGSALLMSVITAGVELSQDDGNGSLDGKKTASDALSEALGQQLGQAAAQMISKNLNIAPTIEIRPGYRFNIMVSKDLVFDKPYRSFDY